MDDAGGAQEDGSGTRAAGQHQGAAAAGGVAPEGAPSRLERFAQILLVLLLAVGCWRVLAPFFPAILFAVVIAVSTWPAYTWLRGRLGGRGSVASLLACSLTLLVALGPVLLLLMSLGDAARWTLGLLDRGLGEGLPAAPAWLDAVPLIGPAAAQWWTKLGSDPESLKELGALFAAPARQAALVSGRALGNAALQVALTALLLFVLYRSGEALAHRLRQAAQRVGGSFAQELVDTARDSMTGVMFGVLGAGLAQATVAAIGFSIVGMPSPFLLGALTFVLSMVPFGPPLIWGGAAVWLFQHDQTGWGLFMLVYGLFGISSIDNVLKPLLISRANHLPFVLTLMGVVGGVLSFGVMGVFLGPTLLALSVDLGGQWLRRSPVPDPGRRPPE